jgi:hypothetical protein
MLADMARNHPGIGVKTSPGGEADCVIFHRSCTAFSLL